MGIAVSKTHTTGFFPSHRPKKILKDDLLNALIYCGIAADRYDAEDKINYMLVEERIKDSKDRNKFVIVDREVLRLVEAYEGGKKKRRR